jgi:hypothetical protein
MLFDLRGAGRRRTVQVVYITLAVLMGGGLVLFGIGGSVSGGLVDAITGNSGTASTSVGSYEKRVREVQAQATAHPKDAAVFAQLARARFQLASAGDNFNQNTGEFSAEGKRQLAAAGVAWQKHLKLAGNKPDDGVAGVMVQAYSALNDAAHAVEAQEIITEARPKSATFATLAILAFQAGQTNKAELARKKAIELADPDQREIVKSQIDQFKPQASPTPTATPTPAKGSKKDSGK